MKIDKRSILPSILLVASSALTQAVNALEQPKFEVKEKIGDLQIRQYEQHVVARTLVSSTFKKAGNEGFRRLAGYIFGDNHLDKKIAMTAPVGLTPALQEATQKKFWVTFTIPAEYEIEELPQPDDSRVEFETVPSRYVAVLPYKGNWSEGRYRKYETRLLSLLEETEGWQTQGEATWSRYDPPFMPGFMRTNEVAIEVVPVIEE